MTDKDTHYKKSKQQAKQIAEMDVTPLTDQARVKEIAEDEGYDHLVEFIETESIVKYLDLIEECMTFTELDSISE